jgi:hypothetical protein
VKYISIVTILFIVFCSCAHNKNIYYDLTETKIAEEIKIGIEEMSKAYGRDLSSSFTAYISDDIYFSVTLIPDIQYYGAFKAISKKSNRFIKIDKNLKIPIIFYADFMAINSKGFNAETVIIGGYNITFNHKYEVISKGLLF